MTLEKDAIIGHYKIISAIGKGGMGEVFLAQDTKLDRKVAIKFLNEEFARDADKLNRFVQEAKAASALNHPNILTVYEIGQADEQHFIVSEYVKGKTLRQKLQREPLTVSETLDITIQIAAALCAAHEAGIVHRDIKPENVMIRADGLVKVLDFGLAKLMMRKTIDSEAETRAQVQTQAGMILGTVAYMSPEQARGKTVDARTDIFSFGVLVYEMLSGKLPFAGNSSSDVIASILKTEPAPLSRFDVPKDLARIVGKSLRKNADERYQHIKDLLIDLKDFKQDLEFEAKLQRSTAPSKTENLTAEESGAFTKIQNTPTTSSIESVASKIKNYKIGFTIGLIVLLFTAAGFGYWFFANRSSNTKQIESIAVLPFENGSGDANLNYLSDGLSESLIDKLSQLPQLKVIARSSSFKYRGENIDLQDAANKLGVQTTVTGRVVQRGDNLAIRVEMIDVRDNKQLWGEQYNRRVMDALAIQQEIAQTVSEKLRLKLSGAQEQQIAKRDTVNPQAYDLLLKGGFLYARGGTEDLKKAIVYYQQAIVVDPNYALAYAKLSECYRLLFGNSILDPKEFAPKAKAAAQKAFELDPNLPDAQLELANHYADAWDWDAAEAKFRHAIELNPNFALARSTYSYYLSSLGRYDESLAEARRAKELDPLSLSTIVSLGVAHLTARRYDEAIAEFKKVLEADSNSVGTYYWLGLAYSSKGMYREAIDAYQESIRLGNKAPSIQTYLGAAYAMTGERKKAQAILRHSETSGEYVSPGELAVLYTALDEREKAFASLEKAYAIHDLQLQFLKVEPRFDPLRDDPRFEELLRKVGFP